jgi:polyhydroxybutyrate depolymerase
MSVSSGDAGVEPIAEDRTPSTLTVSHDGVTYAVPVHVPQVRPAEPLLVLDLHSSHGNALGEAWCSRLDEQADRYGFVIARPEGVIPAETPNPDRLWLWNVPGVPTTTGLVPGADDRDDIAFLTAVIDTAADRLGTAPEAALVGLSGGARMSSAYAAAHPERVVALAAVAGLRSSGLNSSSPEHETDGPAEDRRHGVPVIAFHGDADDTNPYQGGDAPRWGRSIPDALEDWAAYNHAAGQRESRVAERVSRITYGDDPHNEVTLYRIDGGGHSWPGGPEDEAFSDLDATGLIAEFFAARAATL